MQLYRALYETLVVLGDDGLTLEPGVAESWEVSEDGLIYTFHLRDDARWSDGRPVVAQHFVNGWFRAVMPDSVSESASWHFAIDGVEELYDQREAFLVRWHNSPNGATFEKSLANWGELYEQYTANAVWAEDDHTLKVRLQSALAYFPYLLTFPCFSPLPAALDSREFDLLRGFSGALWLEEHHFADPAHAVFNGPYRLERAWTEEDERIHLVANDQYWNAGQVGHERVRLDLYETNEQLVMAFDRGDVQWVPAAHEGERIEQMILTADPLLHHFPIAGTYWYDINCREEVNGRPNPFADPALRRAVAFAFDRAAMAEAAGPLTRPQPTLIPSDTVPGYTPPADAVADYDLDAAHRLIAAAGYGDLSELGTITIRINHDYPAHARIAQPLVDALGELGFDVRIVSTDFRTFLDEAAAGNFHICRRGWFGDFPDPATFLELYDPEGDSNHPGYANPRFAELLEAAQAATDPAERMARFREAEALLLEDAVVVPVYQYGSGTLYDAGRLVVPMSVWGPPRFDRVRRAD